MTEHTPIHLPSSFYEQSFHYLNSSETADEHFEKHSPANLAQKLWTMDILYSHLAPVVESAQKGFSLWKKTALSERINCLKKYQENIRARKDLLAQTISLETGKPLWETKGEVDAVIAKVDITINESLKRVSPYQLGELLPATTGEVFFRPIGPSLIIGPFNFPCHLANGQIVSALLTGCSIIFKPSEKTAQSGHIMMEALAEANFPSGVVNLIQGSGEVAKRLLQYSEIKGVFFTGSKEVGVNILSQTYSDLSKLVALEMGGKNCTILHESASTELALYEILKASYLTTGQRCTCTSVVAIHRSLVDSFMEKFHQLAKKIIIDHPIIHEKTPFMGPLIDEKSVEKYLLYMGMAKREGLEEVMRGKHLEDKPFKGHYVSPSIHYVEKSENKSLFLKSEIFGPSCTFVAYDDIEEAISIANDSDYGLAFSIFCKEETLFKKCQQEIDAGLINWNRTTIGSSSKLPFGGVKGSGNYRPAGISMIDSTTYPVSSLLVNGEMKIEKPVGLGD